MPLTLYWYILRDIVKLLLTCTAVLVVLLAMGSAIKPISEGLLGPLELLKVILYTIPGMLPFALPFACAFASTLVFFRLSQDNEVTACAASGISYRELLMPVLALGLVLTLGIFYLSNWVVPHFWRLVAMEIEKDVASLVVRQIQSGEVVKLGSTGMLLYADEARSDVPIEQRTEGPTPYSRLMLRGVAVGRLDRDNILRDNYSAEVAVVDLYRDEDQNRTFATMMLSGVTIVDGDSGTMMFGDRQRVEAQEIPSFFKQKPKFLSIRELRALSENPQSSVDVRDAKAALVSLLAEQAMLYGMHNDLEKAAGLELTDPRGQRYRVLAPAHQLNDHDISMQAAEGQKIEVRLEAGGVVTQRLDAESAKLEVQTENLDEEPRLTLILERVQVIDPALPAPSNLRQIPLPLLRYQRPVMAPLREARPVDLIDLAGRYNTEALSKLAARLRIEMTDLMREIASRLHERAATAVNCVLVLVLGAVMSMFLRRQVPLAIFFWCFMPTVVSFLMITSGQHLIGGDATSAWGGIAMVWGGNAALLAITLIVYKKLGRN